ncbi:MAG TPA: AraC family ligand binding domain-containing protein [Noviherbaspirillum sp.]|uniref:AraC family ligand binding domain-containing protein n=1 Tax=Noviherbaspirillum sp. TaxID=1926288 RepID=UPI002DDC9525|nr:AraC family ligand binding domain-containing protein [Noviherbaspirillum sp.]HEV2611005.1 AraC family ligand binding domain-containing protein [Noviherbaspirillum sp.]
MKARTKHAFPRHTHDQLGIGVMIHGAQSSLSGHGIVEAGMGDTITVNPGEVHDGAPLGGAARAWKIMYFSPALVVEQAGVLLARQSTAQDIESEITPV